MTLADARRLPFTRHDFDIWYERLREARLEPARRVVADAISDILDKELPEFDRSRFRVLTGEIKDASRVWHEINRRELSERIAILDDIIHVCSDLISVRIVCNNLTDVTFLAAIFESIPVWSGSGHSPQSYSVSLQRGSTVNFVKDPKESGYRAFHAGVFVTMANLEALAPVLCEVHVRTLLQDAWGRLTQEDTYGAGLNLLKRVECSHAKWRTCWRLLTTLRKTFEMSWTRLLIGRYLTAQLGSRDRLDLMIT